MELPRNNPGESRANSTNSFIVAFIFSFLKLHKPKNIIYRSYLQSTGVKSYCIQVTEFRSPTLSFTHLVTLVQITAQQDGLTTGWAISAGKEMVRITSQPPFAGWIIVHPSGPHGFRKWRGQSSLAPKEKTLVLVLLFCATCLGWGVRFWNSQDPKSLKTNVVVLGCWFFLWAKSYLETEYHDT